MVPLYRHALLLLLTSCLLVCGCSTAKDVGKSLGDLATVHAELIKKFGEENVNLQVNTFRNRKRISVTYVNSALNQKTAADRARRAQETAETVKQHYPAIKNVSEIWVGFMRMTTRLVIFNQSEMLDAHGFDNEARALSEPHLAPAESPSELGVRYLANQDKTEISGGIIQLEGTLEKGVTLLPHFSVAGDANKFKPKPPAEVSLDFASYSEKPKFPNVTRIALLSDDKVVYQTKGQFSTSKIGNDMYSEFLYLKVPTGEFLKIASGSTVTVRLNEREYVLTGNLFRQIQRMSEFIRKSQNARS